MNASKENIIHATIQAVRLYGMSGVRMQNIATLAGISQGAVYRHFETKEQLLLESFVYVDRQAAALFDEMDLDMTSISDDPMTVFHAIWQPYYRFWTSRPDETVFYHRFRDSVGFSAYDVTRDVSYFQKFISIAQAFMDAFPNLRQVNQRILWLHVLTTTVMYAKYVVEGVLDDDQETEDMVFTMLTCGLSGYLGISTPPHHRPLQN